MDARDHVEHLLALTRAVQAALERQDPVQAGRLLGERGERLAALVEACRADPRLRRQVRPQMEELRRLDDLLQARAAAQLRDAGLALADGRRRGRPAARPARGAVDRKA